MNFIKPAAMLVASSLVFLSAQALAASTEVIATGLDNPRGITTSKRKVGGYPIVYVTEAGSGGPGPSIIDAEGKETFYGPSGAVTAIKNGNQQRIVSGLPSLSSAGGDFSFGPNDIILQNDQQAYVVMGFGANAASRDDLGDPGADLGRLLKLKLKSGKTNSIADLAAYELENNPDGDTGISNPNGAVQNFGGILVVDAGGNSILDVRGKGRVSTLAVIPERASGSTPDLESSPVAADVGPNGNLYVGEFTGFPYPIGGARIYSLDRKGNLEVYMDGFTNIIDIAFAPDGTLYVLEFATNGLLSGDPTGALHAVSADKTVTQVDTSPLTFPAGLAVDRDGRIYVSNNGPFSGSGEVLRITP
jgi:hypothetical protein